MPGQNSLGFDDYERASPAQPQPRQPRPKNPIARSQTWSRFTTLSQYPELMMQSGNLDLQLSAAAEAR